MNNDPTSLEEKMHCQYYYRLLAEATWPDPRSALALRKYWYVLRRHIWYGSVLGPVGMVRRIILSTRHKTHPPEEEEKSRACGDNRTLNLKTGELVEVLSAKEIFDTLDTQNKHMGLQFTREMTRFCGRKFKVFKRVDRIILEATGEMRVMRSPTVLLEGVICDGKFHGGCTRSCFCFWREVWLRRAVPQETPA